VVEHLVYTDALTSALIFSHALLSAPPKVNQRLRRFFTLSQMRSKNFTSVKSSVKSEAPLLSTEKDDAGEFLLPARYFDSRASLRRFQRNRGRRQSDRR
jgi:hypothetical protein